MSDKDQILKLKHGERFVISESDYGKAEIWLIYDTYMLFGIPQFGGMPYFHQSYNKTQIDIMIKEYESWT